jgi:hypothetical protein
MEDGDGEGTEDTTMLLSDVHRSQVSNPLPSPLLLSHVSVLCVHVKRQTMELRFPVELFLISN